MSQQVMGFKKSEIELEIKWLTGVQKYGSFAAYYRYLLLKEEEAESYKDLADGYKGALETYKAMPNPTPEDIDAICGKGPEVIIAAK